VTVDKPDASQLWRRESASTRKAFSFKTRASVFILNNGRGFQTMDSVDGLVPEPFLKENDGIAFI
jgi:hypothetical protein